MIGVVNLLLWVTLIHWPDMLRDIGRRNRQFADIPYEAKEETR